MELVLEQQKDGMIALEGNDEAGKALIKRHGVGILTMVAQVAQQEKMAHQELTDERRARLVEIVRSCVGVECEVSWRDAPRAPITGLETVETPPSR